LLLLAGGNVARRYLTVTLFCEGREDAHFLEGVVARQLAVLDVTDPGFDVGDVLTQPCRTVESAERIDAAISLAADEFHLLLIHHDHNERAKIDVLRRRVDPTVPKETRLIAVVPVRETEAWVLADPVAFPRGSQVGLLPTRPRDVETIPDPKLLLKQVLGRPYDERIAELIGERIDLDRLALVPGYQAFLEDLDTALKELHFL
jgi:hypothetical protein